MAESPTASLHVPEHPVRFVTAASLFDGHDASINIMRRILQSQGVEVIHLGHNRSVDDIVTAVVQEDTNGVALSSYQGGHVEYFKYLIDRLRDAGYGHVKIYGGGGGVITADEITELHDYGVARIFSPEDGQTLGLAGMINSMVAACDVDLGADGPPALGEVLGGSPRALARLITCIESGSAGDDYLAELRSVAATTSAPVLGITGTGGSGKSSLTDELVRRFRLDQEDKLRIGIIAIDPTRRRGGGALLGDRIRMNSLDGAQVYFRSIATRGAASEVPAAVADSIAAMKAAGFDLVIVETPGIGQADSGITPLSDVSLYVMTPEFGAASQLEKIDMLDWADVVAINKFERRGAEDALRDVRRQVARNRELFSIDIADLPVFGTIAARFNDDGVTALYQELLHQLSAKGLTAGASQLSRVDTKFSSQPNVIVPADKVRYLADIAATVRGYHSTTESQARSVRRHHQLIEVNEIVDADLSADVAAAATAVAPETVRLLEAFEVTAADYADPKHQRISQSGTPVSRVALPGSTKRASSFAGSDPKISRAPSLTPLASSR
ncbi:MAG: cobalamin-dependent protein [Acidimicrobiales bacterium]